MQEERYEQSPTPKPERKARLLRWLTYTAGFVLTFLFGVFVSLFLGLGRQRGPSGKLGEIYSLIQEYYVDSANLDSLTEQALPLILAQLDPHTAYLNAEENKESTESLEGSFAGIGVQFNTLLDTVVVVRVVEGGPSERAGLKAGDRILKADTTDLVRDSISSEDIMKALKGPEDTVVRLTVRRGGKTFVACRTRPHDRCSVHDPSAHPLPSPQ